MDLRAGVLSHTVMQHKVREKRNPDEGGLGGNIFLTLKYLMNLAIEEIE